MSTIQKKYIFVSEYKPLYAMSQLFMVDRGPIPPTLVPVDIIGKLLQQSGKDELIVHEVKKLPNGRFSDAVTLTKENYRLPYDTIANTKPEDYRKVVDTTVAESKVTISPVVKKIDLEESVKIFDKIDPVKEKAGTAPVEDAPSAEHDNVPDEQADNDESPKEVDMFAGLTKAQRKALRREMKAKEAVIAELSNNEED